MRRAARSPYVRMRGYHTRCTHAWLSCSRTLSPRPFTDVDTLFCGRLADFGCSQMSWLARLRGVLGLKSRVRVVGTDLNGNLYVETQPRGEDSAYRDLSPSLHLRYVLRTVRRRNRETS